MPDVKPEHFYHSDALTSNFDCSRNAQFSGLPFGTCCCKRVAKVRIGKQMVVERQILCSEKAIIQRLRSPINSVYMKCE